MPKAIELGVDNVEDVLRNLYNLDGENRGREFDILCPNPGHDDSRPSTGVNLETGLWNCFSCGVSGDLAALGVLVLERSRDDVLALLKPSSAEALLAMVQRRLAAVPLPTSVRRKSRLDALPGDTYEDGPLDELLERGFTEATLRRWGVRYVPSQTIQGNKNEFTIRNSIGIPIRDHRGHLLNWCYRSTSLSGDWQPRYLYYTGGVNETWFGLQHHYHAQHITVVEGGLDAMWLDQCGFPALGLLGTKMGVRKISWLMRYKSVTLLCDRDAAGATATHKIGEMVGPHMPLYIAQYDRKIQPGKKVDPQDLAPVDVEIAMARKISWSTFLLRQAS